MEMFDPYWTYALAYVPDKIIAPAARPARIMGAGKTCQARS